MTLLVVRLGAMGDVLRTIPAVRLVRRALPDAAIHWLVEEKWQVVLEGHLDLDGVIPLPRKRWGRLARNPLRWPRLGSEIAELRRRLRQLDAGLALEFHGNLRSGLACRLSAARVRLGYSGHQQKEGNRLFTTHRVPCGSRRTPRMERNLDLVRVLGIATAPLPDGALPMVSAGDAAARELIDGSPGLRAGYAVISPGASRQQAYKAPPTPLLAAAGLRLVGRGVTPLVVYGPGEEPQARAVVRSVGERALLAPPTDLPTLAALLAGARLYVGGDTGPMHLACAVGCPALGIYGPTDPQVNQPWGVPFRTVYPENRDYSGIKRRDRQAGGFEGIDPARLEAAVDELTG